METVAFWAPDIIPPDQWLVPAILYQDRIATIAPMASLDDPDGMQTTRMREVLGELWERVYFEPKSLDLQELVRARLDWWVRLGTRMKADHWTQQWLTRVQGWPRERVGRMLKALEEAESHRAECRRIATRVADEADQASRSLKRRRAELETRLEELRPVISMERAERRRALAELHDRAADLRSGRWGVDPWADGELQSIHRDIRGVIEEMNDHPSEVRMEVLALRAKLHDCEAEARRVRQLQSIAGRAESTLREAEDRVNDCVRRLDEPWCNDRPWGLHGASGRTMPEGLDTIGWGKIGGDDVFQLLATEGGMWSFNHPGKPWAHSLVAPRWIVEDLLITLAELRVADQPTWALAGRLTHFGDRPGRVRSTALALGFALPCPSSAAIEDAVRFRRKHEQELDTLRRAIQSEITAEFDVLDDAIANVRHIIAEPLAEVTRALELDRRLGLRQLGITTLRELPRGARSLAAGGLATLLAEPLLGESLTARGLAGAAIGGAVLVGARLATTTSITAHERRRLERRAADRPYAYLYQLGRELGLDGERR